MQTHVCLLIVLDDLCNVLLRVVFAIENADAGAFLRWSYLTCCDGMQDILKYARIKPAVHQIEVHPVWQNQYNIDFCHKEVRAHNQLPICVSELCQS